jgi:hypothetical protein
MNVYGCVQLIFDLVSKRKASIKRKKKWSL